MSPRRMRWGGLAAALLLAAAPALAKPWEQLAPSPMGSDADYLRLEERAADSLGVRERAWFEAQSAWRSEREQEASGGWTHAARKTDARFARTAARPLVVLDDDELRWWLREARARWEGRAIASGSPERRPGLLWRATDVCLAAFGVVAAFAMLMLLRRLP